MSNTEHFRVTPEYLLKQGFSVTMPSRFYSKIKITESCWIWCAGVDGYGYGLISKGPKGKNSVHAHRVSWIIHFGPIPEGQNILHDCPDGDNPKCVNPAHLKLGSDRDNIYDAIIKNRWRFGENTKASRISTAIAIEIIRINEMGEMNQTQISKKFGISLTQVNRIVRGKSWRHLRVEQWKKAIQIKTTPTVRSML